MTVGLADLAPGGRGGPETDERDEITMLFLPSAKSSRSRSAYFSPPFDSAPHNLLKTS